MSKEIWEQTAENFNAGKVGQVWFYQGDDLNLILKGHRIEAATLVNDTMVTFVLTEDVMVQIYAGCGLADVNTRLTSINRRSGEVLSAGEVNYDCSNGRRRRQVFAWTTDEYGSEDLEVLFEAYDVQKPTSPGADMFFGVAFRSPSVTDHMIGADR